MLPTTPTPCRNPSCTNLVYQRPDGRARRMIFCCRRCCKIVHNRRRYRPNYGRR